MIPDDLVDGIDYYMEDGFPVRMPALSVWVQGRSAGARDARIDIRRPSEMAFIVHRIVDP